MNSIEQFAKELTELSRKHGLILGADIYNQVRVSSIEPSRQHPGFRYVAEGDVLEWLILGEREKSERTPKPLEPSSLRDEQDSRLRAEEARFREARKIPTEMRLWYEPKETP